jgi:hypothetical protein
MTRRDNHILILIDAQSSSCLSRYMTHSHERCAKGMGFPPPGHRKTVALVAGLHLTGMIAPMALDGPINDEWF